MLAVASRQWWVLVVQGALGILFGVLAIAFPDIALLTLAYLFAAWAIISGASAVAEGWRVAETRGRSWPFAVMGVVSIVAGILAALIPGITIYGLIVLLGAWFVVQGVMEVYTAWRIRAEVSGEWVLALVGLLTLAVGVIVLALPVVGAVLTVALVATWSIIGGIAAVALGLRLRQFRSRLTGAGQTAAPSGA
jgi:uncharacterized membrane protein HdeD (DUF308 family)